MKKLPKTAPNIGTGAAGNPSVPEHTGSLIWLKTGIHQNLLTFAFTHAGAGTSMASHVSVLGTAALLGSSCNLTVKEDSSASIFQSATDIG